MRFTSYNCYIDRLGNLSGKVAGGIVFYYTGKHDCGLSYLSASFGVDTELFSESSSFEDVLFLKTTNHFLCVLIILNF